MASERQIAATYRHGLSVGVGASAPLVPSLEKRAHKIAGNTGDALAQHG